MSVGPIIREMRLEQGIRQNFLADKLKYNHSSGLCEIEKGKFDIKASDIPEVAKALNMDVMEVCKRFFLR